MKKKKLGEMSVSFEKIFFTSTLSLNTCNLSLMLALIHL